MAQERSVTFVFALARAPALAVPAPLPDQASQVPDLIDWRGWHHFGKSLAKIVKGKSEPALKVVVL